MATDVRRWSCRVPREEQRERHGVGCHRSRRPFDDERERSAANPSWAVDGTMVVYHKIIPTPDGFQLQRAFSPHPDFQLTRIIGGNFPAWSPDGERLALGVREAAGQKPPPQALAPAPGRALQLNSLQIMKPDGSNRRVLFNRPGTSAFAPAWSPDGTQIAFSVGRYFRAPGHPNGEVALVKPDGTGYLTLDADGANNGFPSWSPDGKRLVYKKDHHLVIRNVADLDLIRFGGHLPKGGYDVQTDGRHTEAAPAPPVH